MKIWKTATALGIDALSEVLNWIAEQGGEVFQVLFIGETDTNEIRAKREIYRIIWYSETD